MVGFPSEPTETVEGEQVAELDQDPKVKSFKDPLDSYNPKLEDFAFLDTFLDFDSVNWLESDRNLEDFSVEDNQFVLFKEGMEMIQDRVSEATRIENQCVPGLESINVKSEPFDDKSETTDGVSGQVMSESDVSRLMLDGPEERVFSGGSELNLMESVPVDLSTSNLEGEELKKTEGLTCSIAVEMEKVCLAANGNEKSDGAKNESDSSDSQSKVSGSSSSSSDSDSSSCTSEEESDKEEEKKQEDLDVRKEYDVAGELEEGEIKDEDVEDVKRDDDEDDDDDDADADADADAMIAWSDDEDEDAAVTQTKEPIKSKNELQELPPVPAVDVTLEGHHTMLPVGVVLSVLGAQVIVEGVEKHNPLNEGSILWITEKRAPLGLVDEIFGPVKNPYYVVRYNVESEVPDGIQQGAPISFVAEFAGHVLNEKSVYKKGYDASGENDEEISDEVEFSDDEKEAEYKRMQRMAKRGMKEQKPVDTRKNNKTKKKQMNGTTTPRTEEWTGQSPQPPHSNEIHAQPRMLSLAHHHGSQLASLLGQQTVFGMGGLVPAFQQANRPVFPGGLSSNAGVAWGFQNNQQQPYPNQMGMANIATMPNQMGIMPNMMGMQNQSNAMMLQQPQFGGNQMPMIQNVGGEANLNLFGGPWAGMVGQNCINQQTFGMSMSSQGNIPMSQHTSPQFSTGGGRGDRPFHQGRGRGRGRGRSRGRGHFGRR